ncbi:Gfo/Idh/MocA family oxidoreductase [Roseococcus sp. SDR]|uniref:Gfo/Idh/MocA family protein n=1 Tax=Roseococcus sp. SDR TaxID=2835532 RepID=UPI001BCF8FA4|nr:Gfo/Idh/MocA family oxidoreductase [Roseococcus sp. SDR]MBS7790986.1 Gfo/Idh/MocA family oxidoreductase [Roseococcus sp. SDR]MBV1846300.1 Gfo/Idh/MocA family oxidoreductase [Roseococcus sp. SDR]
MKSLKIGVFGAGHFGRFHALKLRGAARAALAGLHDPDPARAALVAGEAGCQALTAEALMAASDAVIIATPTLYHARIAEQALAMGRHVFVEKPITATLAEADALIALAARERRVLMVGQIERHSAAIRTLRENLAGRRLMSLEATRVAPFRPRSLDVSVVLDLMIHDLDLILSLVPAPLTEVRAVGGAVMTNLPDWAVAQLRFANGAQAQVTASRVAVGLERKLRALGPEGEMRVDFMARSIEFLAPDGGQGVEHMAGWSLVRRSWTDYDSLEAEQSAFIAAILDGIPHEANGDQGRAALDAALRVEAALKG